MSQSSVGEWLFKKSFPVSCSIRVSNAAIADVTGVAQSMMRDEAASCYLVSGEVNSFDSCGCGCECGCGCRCDADENEKLLIRG
jgi:hypothetical protein